MAQKVSGHVYEMLEDNKNPLVGANIFQINTTNGTSTDLEGFFSFDLIKKEKDQLIISYVGYQNDTLALNSQNLQNLDIILQEENSLSEVEVVSRQKGGFVSRASTQSIESISGEGLKQAACCNLSESFENSATVSVSFSDAVTGAKQIEMLGLAGKYTQFMQENIPNLRGLAEPYGLGYYPGDWLQSIQVSKGASSVINGYESITGQINLELKKPNKDSEKFFLNLYGNHFGKFEGNINGKIKINDNWSTMIFFHGENMSVEHDNNNDSFLDMPLVNQYNFYNRWNYKTDNIHFDIGIQYLTENRRGGQVYFNPNEERTEDNGYGIGVKTDRIQSYLKLGYIFNSRDFTSIGFQNQFVSHKQNSFFGLTDYDADQISYYGNLLFQSYIATVAHSYTTGISFMYDSFNEVLNDSTFQRIETVPGAFFQYTYSDGKKLNIIAGIRGDWNSRFGFLITPRFNIRYSPTEKDIFRVSAGKGYNSPNVISDNTGLFTTSKTIHVASDIDIEAAWNTGLSYNRYFNISDRELILGFDLFYTNFQNQVVVNRDTDPFNVYIANLDGRSYATSFQGEVRYEIIKDFDVLLAFRYNDVRTTIQHNLVEKGMVNRYKGLLSLSYATNLKKWQFDLNMQVNGDARLYNTSFNPPEYQRAERSPVYMLTNAQVTKYFKRWEIYLGGENLTNYKQENPIISPDDPFGEYFDATLVWAPIMGIKIYAGIRVTIK
jgi:outer membrane receptor for ferrienterochelin and colicin